jgi:cob(I)alamin adenosyltransferase
VKTFNKRGDQGETSLMFNVRVCKSDARCEAYGTIDEATASLGLARSLCRKKPVRDALLAMQKDLFILAAELATPVDSYDKLARKHPVVTCEAVETLEKLIESLEDEVEMPREFVTPGTSPGSAALHLARAILRRAERRAVALNREGLLPNEEVLKYLNRAADLVFTLACYEDMPEKI